MKLTCLGQASPCNFHLIFGTKNIMKLDAIVTYFETLVQARRPGHLEPSPSSTRTHDDSDTAEHSDGKEKKKALARRFRSVEEDHLENIYDDTLDTESVQ